MTPENTGFSSLDRLLKFHNLNIPITMT